MYSSASLPKPRVLFLCTGNSARSQMAEGLLRAIAGDRLEVFSAGAYPLGVNPFAIQAMAARGIDISHHRSKHFRVYLQRPFDYVITLCDHAAAVCPIFPGSSQRIHWSFPDSAAVEGSEAEVLAAFVRVRDAIEFTLIDWAGSLEADQVGYQSCS